MRPETKIMNTSLWRTFWFVEIILTFSIFKEISQRCSLSLTLDKSKIASSGIQVEFNTLNSQMGVSFWKCHFTNITLQQLKKFFFRITYKTERKISCSSCKWRSCINDNCILLNCVISNTCYHISRTSSRFEDEQLRFLCSIQRDSLSHFINVD